MNLLLLTLLLFHYVLPVKLGGVLLIFIKIGLLTSRLPIRVSIFTEYSDYITLYVMLMSLDYLVNICRL